MKINSSLSFKECRFLVFFPFLIRLRLGLGLGPARFCSEQIFLAHIFQELVNDAECEQISEELSGAESTKWLRFYHAESKRLLGLISKDSSLSNTLGF